MKRTTFNLLIDLSAALLLLLMLLTGYLLRFPLPPGSNKDLSLWGFTRHQWGNVHFWVSAGLLVVLLLHLALHWEWVVTTIRRQLHIAKSPHRSRLASWVMTALLVAGGVVLFAWTAHRSVRELDDPCCTEGQRVDAPRGGNGSAPGEAYAPDNPRISFWHVVYPVLQNSCLNCHGPRRAAGGFRVDRREDYFRTDRGTPLVVSGSSKDSPLMDMVSGRRQDIALPERHRLSAKDVAILKDWIDAGAPWPDHPQAR